jgi:hypothetical protein
MNYRSRGNDGDYRPGFISSHRLIFHVDSGFDWVPAFAGTTI